MSLKKNILANYISQLYVAVIGIVVLPLYIKYMGAEAYGLVGFFTMLQAWFALLDLGLTPTIGRETARLRGGVTTALAFRQLLRALNVLFVSMAVIGGGILWMLSHTIASKWLHVGSLEVEDVVQAVHIMIFCIALKWLGGIYRGVISGSERLVWLSNFNIVIATFRFVAVFGTMSVFGFTPKVFFYHQLIVAVFELAGLFVMSRYLLPALDQHSHPVGWSFRPILPVLKFSLSIAFTSSVWILVTQTDKLILSGILPLAEYGYFSLAVLVAGGIMIISGPISNALLPRMARMHAEGSNTDLINLYRKSTQLVAVLAGAASVTIAYCAEPLLFVWTADQKLSESTAPILRLYAIGNGILTLGAFPYYLQYARGNLKYHLIGSGLMVSLLIPIIVLAVNNFGAVGAGYTWLGLNLFFLLFWVGYVHQKLEPGLHLQWLFKDCLGIVVGPILILSPLIWINVSFQERWQTLMFIAGVSTAALLAAVVCSDCYREMLRNRLRRWL
ncbi:lipopolysaccharide biosynthesis protein [Pseudomonas sp. NUPR-001]|uniref:lipopolysaccharide biosynthesis protein n=1 Tax=Pseudomonas sp. NUPR-001 TaxID=3416058 RepID=UPI003F9C7B60